jgi:hypothetical protein
MLKREKIERRGGIWVELFEEERGVMSRKMKEEKEITRPQEYTSTDIAWKVWKEREGQQAKQTA